ncbi:hypothetical protein [Streptomyces sp. NPDC001100]
MTSLLVADWQHGQRKELAGTQPEVFLQLPFYVGFDLTVELVEGSPSLSQHGHVAHRALSIGCLGKYYWVKGRPARTGNRLTGRHVASWPYVPPQGSPGLFQPLGKGASSDSLRRSGGSSAVSGIGLMA